LEATREFLSLPVGDATVTSTNHQDEGYPGRQDHTVDGFDTDRLERDPVHSKHNDRIDPIPNDALHQPVPFIELEE